jgi:hypothetical protein
VKLIEKELLHSNLPLPGTTKPSLSVFLSGRKFDFMKNP